MQAWTPQQGEIVALLRVDFEQVLHRSSMEGEGWASWRRFYFEERSKAMAMGHAPEGDRPTVVPHPP